MLSDEELEKKERGRIRYAAFDALARREHSHLELTAKLKRKSDDLHLIQSVLQELVDEGLQSDERFAESFVHERIQRGQGPIKIRYELRNKGVTDECVEHAIAHAECEWAERAREVLQRKFGLSVAADQKERQRRLRFLQQRGFQQDICFKLVSGNTFDNE